ncbi:MAG: hypothetical protein ACYDCC_07515 [Actinomycetota bacterium]
MKKFGVAITMMLLSIGMVSMSSTPALALGRCDSYAFCSITEGFKHGWDSHNGRTFFFWYFGGDGVPFSQFRVDIVDNGIRLGTFNFNSAGDFNISFTVPATLAGGRNYTIRAVGRTKGGGQITVHTVIFVSHHCYSRNSSGICTRVVADILSRPGSPSLPLGALVLGLALVPLSMLPYRRRRLRPAFEV